MPLFTFIVLAAVFSQPVIRGLGVVVVDADRSDTSRALVEQVAASPNLRIAARAGDLASAASAIRSGEAIAALYIPANFERDVKAERRPQVVGFYNQQYLTAAGIASAGLSASLSAAAASAAPAAHAAPKPARIGSLVAETIVLGNPQTNYAQFLLRSLLPMIIHVVIALAGGYAVGSEFRRRSVRTWLACAGGNPVIALAGKLAPLFVMFFLIMLAVPLVLEGAAGYPLQGRRADDRCGGVSLHHRLPGARCAAAASARRPPERAGPDRPHRVAGVRLCRRQLSDARHERIFLCLERDPAFALVHGGAVRPGSARPAGVRFCPARLPCSRRSPRSTCCWRSCGCAPSRDA